jgi:hypothetical protein
VEQQLLQYVSVVWSREVYHFVVTSFSSHVAGLPSWLCWLYSYTHSCLATFRCNDTIRFPSINRLIFII